MAHIKAQTTGKSTIRQLSKKKRIQNWRTKEEARTRAKEVQSAASLYKTISKRLQSNS